MEASKFTRLMLANHERISSKLEAAQDNIRERKYLRTEMFNSMPGPSNYTFACYTKVNSLVELIT